MASNQSLPEITPKAVVLAVVLAVILAAANAYLGLFAGMTVSASIPAAVMSMGILRLFKKSNILENNIVQTAASAGESLAAGVIFTLPALVIMDYWDSFNYWWVTIIAGFGGLLGVLFTIPLRRALIVEADLKFPEGIATAEVLESGQRGGKDIWFIVKSAIAGGLFKLGAGSGLRLVPDTVDVARRMGGSLGYLGTNLSPALLSVGYIVGLNISVLIFLGGAVNWFGAIPMVAASDAWPQYQLVDRNVPDDWNLEGQSFGIVNPTDPNVWDMDEDRPRAWNVFVKECKPVDPNATAEEIAAVHDYNQKVYDALGEPLEAKAYASTIWSAKTRYLGVGGMLIGGLWTILKLRKSLVKGVKSGLKAYQNVGPAGSAIERTEQDMPMKWVLIMIVGSVVPLFLVYQTFVQNIVVTLPMAAVMLVTGFLFAAVAGYMAGIVGSSNNPISGVTIATVTISALLLVLLMGKGNADGPPAAIVIGAVVCCAAAIAGDNMQDLKAGHILKATPWKQQVMQMVGTVASALVMGPVLMLLYKAYGFAGHSSAQANPLIAAQANLMASVSRGVFSGELPWGFVGLGAVMAAGVIALDEHLVRKGSSFRTPVLAVTIGIYLPLELEVPMLLGGLICFAVKRAQKRRQLSREQVEVGDRQGLLFASGLITGEALVGILLAIPIVAFSKPDALAIFKEPSVLVDYIGMGLGLGLLVAIALWLYRVACGSQKTA